MPYTAEHPDFVYLSLEEPAWEEDRIADEDLIARCLACGDRGFLITGYRRIPCASCIVREI